MNEYTKEIIDMLEYLEFFSEYCDLDFIEGMCLKREKEKNEQHWL